MAVHLVYRKTASGNQVYFELLAQVLAPLRLVVSALPPTFGGRVEPQPDAVLVTNLEFLARHAKRHRAAVGIVHHVDRRMGEGGPMGLARGVYYRRKWSALRRGARHADAVVAVSKATQADLQRLGVASRVVYPGIDTGFFRPGPRPGSPKRRLLFVGNPTFRKGFDLLPRIMAELGDGYELTLVTGNRDRPGVAVPHSVDVGRVDRERLRALYQQSDCLLHPSRLEGFGYTIAEAMACGRPVVASRAGSVPELVEHGRGGFLCTPGDAQAHAAAVAAVFEDEARAAAFGAWNRRRALGFGLQPLADGWSDVLRGVEA